MQNCDFIEGMKTLFSYNNLLCVSGESGTGKTTLTLYLLGNLLNSQDSCIWIQAGEQFPLRRLEQLFENSQDKLEYLKEHIFVLPKGNKITSYEEQSHILHHLIASETILPPSLKYIVIDNVSHHLRYKLSQYLTPTDIVSLLDSFYDDQLMPLILFCRRNNIILVLIHEVTYSPSLDKNRPFFYKLYDRLDTIDIGLNNIFNSEKKNLQACFQEMKWNFQYLIKQQGVSIEY